MTNNRNFTKEKEEIDFAYKIRRAMTESSEQLPAATLDRLAQARKLALSRKKEEAPSAVFALGGVLSGANGASLSQNSWFKKLWIAIPLFVLVLGMYLIYEHQQDEQINDLAEIDAAVLADELPPDAYVDNGFNAYINKEEKKKDEE